MLTEIGVMKARSEDISHYFVYILKKYPKTLKEHVNTFLKDEKKKNIQDKTIIMRLEIFLNLVKWYSPVDAEKFNISAVNESDIESFFIHLIEKGHQQAYIYHAFINLSIFFRWCLVQKIILSNPCSKHKTSKPPQQVTVCDNDVVNKIMRFIKNPNSDPQMAMTLLLILVWGLKSEDLSHAKIEI
jgi:site-specific recombinase XerD